MLSPQAQAYVTITASQNVRIANCIPLLQAQAQTFLKLDDNPSTDVVMTGNDLRDFKRPTNKLKKRRGSVILVGNIE